MKILINYADNNYIKTQRINSFTGRYIAGFDKVFSFGPQDIDSTFYTNNSKIFSINRGNGLWLWKPYLIDKVLSQANEGDIIFYCDSGSFFLRSIDPLIESMSKEDIWVSDIPLIEQCFTKEICFKDLNCNEDKYRLSNQIQATFFMVRCSDKSKKFVKKWLNLCCEYKLISPQISKRNCRKCLTDFIAHREDQSLLSLLIKKEGITPHRDPSQRGIVQETYRNTEYLFKKTYHNDTYKTTIFLHKSKNVGIVHCMKILINTFLLYVFPDGRYLI